MKHTLYILSIIALYALMQWGESDIALDLDTDTFPRYYEADSICGIEYRYSDKWCKIASGENTGGNNDCYNTIKAAFQNGTGDCFYRKNGQFVARHRNDLCNDLYGLGWEQMPYSEVMRIAREQEPEKMPLVNEALITPTEQPKPRARQTKTPYYYWGTDGPTGHGDICYSDADLCL